MERVIKDEEPSVPPRYGIPGVFLPTICRKGIDKGSELVRNKDVYITLDPDKYKTECEVKSQHQGLKMEYPQVYPSRVRLASMSSPRKGFSSTGAGFTTRSEPQRRKLSPGSNALNL